MTKFFYLLVALVVVATALIGWFWDPFLWTLVVTAPLILLGIYDLIQTRHSILRNFPVAGHFRFLLEAIRPEIQQYFIESEIDGRPYTREQRSLIYERAKHVRETMPFGTQLDVNEPGYEWVEHSIAALSRDDVDLRVTVGNSQCKKPYSASILNISAMSYGSLSPNAILALNEGANLGGFAHNTGEGGLSPHHEAGGGDLFWQIGTAYFGCRNDDGTFSPEKFAKRVSLPAVKMVEIKLSQGAKPGHGGILPAAKVTEEISAIRGVPMGKDVISPPAHSAFSTPLEMMNFIVQLRELSGGLPIGFKLCLGKSHEFLAICKAMIETGVRPDFITVDGGEGGTGAAPVEFSDSVGAPLTFGLPFVHNALVGFGLRDEIRIIASGKVVNAFDLVKRFALGADLCNAARAMMLALGCIQARTCNSNKCPVGVATGDPGLVRGLVVADKNKRVAQFHHELVHATVDLMAAMGVTCSEDIGPEHVNCRVNETEVKNWSQIFPLIEKGQLLNGGMVPEPFGSALESASASTFRPLVAELE